MFRHDQRDHFAAQQAR
jgi:hypothetical protein